MKRFSYFHKFLQYIFGNLVPFLFLISSLLQMSVHWHVEVKAATVHVSDSRHNCSVVQCSRLQVSARHCRRVSPPYGGIRKIPAGILGILSTFSQLHCSEKWDYSRLLTPYPQSSEISPSWWLCWLNSAEFPGSGWACLQWDWGTHSRQDFLLIDTLLEFSTVLSKISGR